MAEGTAIPGGANVLMSTVAQLTHSGEIPRALDLTSLTTFNNTGGKIVEMLRHSDPIPRQGPNGTLDLTSLTGSLGLGENLSASDPGLGAQSDHRVRIRAKPGMEGEVYGSGPISILNDTNGMVFPYTPMITWSQSVNYSPLNLVHVNQDFHYYGSTPNLSLGITGRFTAQNTMQAQYCFACIHFLRTVSKMRFGTSDEKRGLPPPMLVLDGYGDQMFNQLPIIINQFSIELINDVDYVRVPMSAGEAWVPAEFSITMNVIIQNTPAAWRDQFNLDAFRNGEMLGATKGWI